MLVDLLQRKCITARYAEQMLFNLNIVQKLEQRRLADCVEVVDWGMQLEDWEEHTPEQLLEALATLAQLAQRLLEGIESCAPVQPKRDRKASSMKQAKSRREGPVEIPPGAFAARPA
ncbi:MAG: DUF3969 family protein [Deltaproteobacteria bacterium]|nr:DUF3969 family protein [Deltaproteobacteria bacterium]